MKSKTKPQTDTDDLFATTESTEGTEKKNKSIIISENSPSKTKSNDNSVCSVCSVCSVVKKSSGIPWLGDIPEHWEVKRLRYVTSINDETLPEDTLPDYELLYVDIGSIDPAVGITDKESFTFENAPSRARRIVRDGDVIISTVRTYLKAIASIKNPEDNLIVSTGFAVIRSKNVFQGYLSYTVKAPFFVETVVSRSIGVSYPAINASDLGLIEIPLPPLPEQKAIAEYLDRKTGRIDSLISKKENLVELLKEKRGGLISSAVTGKLTITNYELEITNGKKLTTKDTKHSKASISNSQFAIRNFKIFKPLTFRHAQIGGVLFFIIDFLKNSDSYSFSQLLPKGSVPHAEPPVGLFFHMVFAPFILRAKLLTAYLPRLCSACEIRRVFYFRGKSCLIENPLNLSNIRIS
ncbi:MAG: restriction endonuclease subunit S [Lentisphaerota bacterium]